MQRTDIENRMVEQLACRLCQLRGRLEGTPDEVWLRAETELRVEQGAGCRGCTRQCRARGALQAGMRCGVLPYGDGSGLGRGRSEVSDGYAQIPESELIHKEKQA